MKQWRCNVIWLVMVGLGWGMTHPLPAAESGEPNAQLEEEAPQEEATPNTGEGRVGVLMFQNGDRLLGHLEGVTADQEILWSRSDALTPMNFEARRLLEIRFGEEDAQEEGTQLDGSATPCEIRLTNGDWVTGVIESLDEEALVMEPLSGDPLTFPISQVRELNPLPPEDQLVYEAPRQPEEWVMGEVDLNGREGGEWRYEDGAFYATKAASMARELNLPEKIRMEMDLGWRGVLSLAIALYTDHWQPINLGNKENEPPFGTFYSLQLNNFTGYLMAVDQHAPLRRLDHVRVPVLNRKNQAKLEILVDQASARITLLVEGEKVKTWQDEQGFVGEGSGIRLVHQGKGQVKIDNFRILKWDGRLRRNRSDALARQKDVIRLRDGGVVVGDLLGIREGTARMATRDEEKSFPLTEIERIRRAWANQEKADPEIRPGTVQAFFREGGRLTLNLESWDPEKGMVAESVFGEAIRYPPGAFTRLRFHVDAEASEE